MWWHRALKMVISCSGPVYFMLLLRGCGPWIWLYRWLFVPLHKTGSDKRVKWILTWPLTLSLSLSLFGRRNDPKCFPLIDTFNFQGAVTASYIGLGFAIKGQAVGGFQMKEFINMVGNKGCLSVEYWLCERRNCSNWWDLQGRMLAWGGSLITAIRLD